MCRVADRSPARRRLPASRWRETLARDTRYDLHALLELTDRGCPAELAARILAPIEASGADRADARGKVARADRPAATQLR